MFYLLSIALPLMYSVFLAGNWVHIPPFINYLVINCLSGFDLIYLFIYPFRPLVARRRVVLILVLLF